MEAKLSMDHELCGRPHINSVLSLQNSSGGYDQFIEIADTFLERVTHRAFLDCLSIDTYVGLLYNFISGSNGSHAISFFERLAKNLMDEHLDPNLQFLDYDERSDVQIQISFESPLSHRSASDRKKWWEESKRLEEGSLLCFVVQDDESFSLLFLTLSCKSTDPTGQYTFASNDCRSIATAKLASQTRTNVELGFSAVSGVLVELPNFQLATCVPVLENLQQMQKLHRLPFRQRIFPDRLSTDVPPMVEIPPLMYARRPGFYFSLNSILKTFGKSIGLSSRASVDDDELLDELETQIGVDRG
jgi:hypothetical protein